MRGKVSIHALLAECDRYNAGIRDQKQRFNPRTPCGVRQIPIHRRINLHRVSIHALLAECDSMPSSILRRGPKFQSTHSLRSATQGFKNCNAPRHLIELRQVSYITCLSASSVQGVCIDSASPLQAASRSPQSTVSSSSLTTPSRSILSLASASRCITLARSLAG